VYDNWCKFWHVGVWRSIAVLEPHYSRIIYYRQRTLKFIPCWCISFFAGWLWFIKFVWMRNGLKFWNFPLLLILQILEYKYINSHSIQLYVFKTPELNCLEFLCVVIEQLHIWREDYIQFLLFTLHSLQIGS
jgi:hypothetical protein